MMMNVFNTDVDIGLSYRYQMAKLKMIMTCVKCDLNPTKHVQNQM
jgi:hypothetical protein